MTLFNGTGRRSRRKIGGFEGARPFALLHDPFMEVRLPWLGHSRRIPAPLPSWSAMEGRAGTQWCPPNRSRAILRSRHPSGLLSSRHLRRRNGASPEESRPVGTERLILDSRPGGSPIACAHKFVGNRDQQRGKWRESNAGPIAPTKLESDKPSAASQVSFRAQSRSYGHQTNRSG